MNYQFARTAMTLKRSVMRDLLTQVARPNILNFASWLAADENLPNGETRRFLEDDDRVTMRAWAEKEGKRVGFGEVTGMVLPVI